MERSNVMNIIERLPTSGKREIKKRIFLTFSQKIERPVVDEMLRKELIGHLRADLDRLRTLTGYKYGN